LYLNKEAEVRVLGDRLGADTLLDVLALEINTLREAMSEVVAL